MDTSSIRPVNLGAALVLLVDDDEEAVELLRIALRTSRYDVVMASNGQVALEWLRTRAPARLPLAIITDLQMPVMDGWTLCARLDGEPRFAGLPTLIVTGWPEAIPRRARAVFQKPVDIDGVLDRLAELLAASSGATGEAGNEQASPPRR